MSSIKILTKGYAAARSAAGYSNATVERVTANVNIMAHEMHLRSTEQLTTERILEWGSWRRTMGTSQSTVYAYFNSMRSFMIYLDEIKKPYPADRQRIHCKPNYQRTVCLRPNDVHRIVVRTDYQTGLLIRLLYTTGMRISEALHVTPDDLHTDDSIFVNGKWQKSRTVFVTRELRDELLALGVPIDQPIFNMSRAAAYYYIKGAMVTAGYPDAYPHSLRHTFTTTLLRNGASLSHVQRLLGHSNISTTQRYEHLVTDDIKKAHKKYLAPV